MDALRLYVEQLTSDVMNLSDQLVELLAARDELIMLREASDDFVILLNLVHQRRARASRAALLMTARARMRPRMVSAGLCMGVCDLVYAFVSGMFRNSLSLIQFVD